MIIFFLFHVLSSAPVKLIIDTDIGGGGCNDVDDVVALCMAHALQNNGEAEILAILQNTAPLKCAGVISVINHYYGADSIPIGAYNINTPGASLEQEEPLPYVNQLVDEFDSPIKNSSQVDDAVEVYRRVLAAEADHSVVISSIGIATNLASLLQSGPDKHSALSGVDLVSRKVALLLIMGGIFPRGLSCNLSGGFRNKPNHIVASKASSFVEKNWPQNSKIIWSGFEVGAKVQSGGKRFQQCPTATETNPCLQAMVNFEKGPNKSRYSWDPLTTLIAVRGAEAGSCSECTDCNGKNLINPQTGANAWVKGPKTNQTYLLLQDAEKAGEAIDELLCQSPKKHRLGVSRLSF